MPWYLVPAGASALWHRAWLRHQIETFSALLAFCAGNLPVTGEFPTANARTWSFGVFFDLHLNKRLTKQSRRRWFETQLRSLWRHCDIPKCCVVLALNAFTLDESIGAQPSPHTVTYKLAMNFQILFGHSWFQQLFRRSDDKVTGGRPNLVVRWVLTVCYEMGDTKLLGAMRLNMSRYRVDKKYVVLPTKELKVSPCDVRDRIPILVWRYAYNEWTPEWTFLAQPGK